ncbi:DNA-directed RNA polymerase subunit omega [Xanthocytophaga agilis]|uniref:DNA-directed RNA polymerase subunit omega n=1 Tax=Xanthocytophaga agilis TaxID=3048010 RepID=A0AAE3R540_9BACT|nr:DNA-directed RNA polymerase subunit omega [Xanthocytophaga agilis]MDJ1500857.1 DNA-directed RNA polymerase subunit omega [Xanthocytophaga agilis]
MIKPNVSASILTRDNDKLAEPTGNVYESVSVIARRARELAMRNKEELNNKLAEFASTVDNLEEVFENREQIEISRYYERLPKPASVAIDEFLAGKLFRRFRDEEGDKTQE